MAKYLLLKHYRRSAGPENVVDIPMQRVRESFEINLFGHLELVQAIVPKMVSRTRSDKKARGGRVEYALICAPGVPAQGIDGRWGYAVADEAFYPDAQVQPVVDDAGKTHMHSIETGSRVECATSRERDDSPQVAGRRPPSGSRSWSITACVRCPGRGSSRIATSLPGNCGRG